MQNNYLYTMIFCIAMPLMPAETKQKNNIQSANEKLLTALQNNEPVENVQKHIDAGADFHTRTHEQLNPPDGIAYEGQRPIQETALKLAVGHDNVPVVQLLINAKATLGGYLPIQSLAMRKLLVESNDAFMYNGFDNYTDARAGKTEALAELTFSLSVGGTYRGFPQLFCPYNPKCPIENSPCEKCAESDYLFHKKMRVDLIEKYTKNPPNEVSNHKKYFTESLQPHIPVPALHCIIMNYRYSDNLHILITVNKDRIRSNRKKMRFNNKTL